MINLIKRRVKTEKTAYGEKKLGKHVFSVDIRLTKPQIKKLCEDHFGEEIQSVNTHIKPVKTKRRGRNTGYKSRYKHAIITFKNKRKNLPLLQYEKKEEERKIQARKKREKENQEKENQEKENQIQPVADVMKGVSSNASNLGEKEKENQKKEN